MVSKQFLKSTVMYTIAGALPMAAAIILLPFYLTLPTDIYGAYSIYLALSVFIQILTTYSFDTGIYVFYHDYQKDQALLKSYIAAVFGFVIVLGIIAVVFFSFTGDLLIRVLLSGKNIHFFPFGLLSVLTGVFQSIFKVHSNLLQSSENPKLFLWSNLLSFSLIATFTIAGLHFFPQTLWGPVGGRLIATAISAGWVLVRIKIVYGLKYDIDILKSSFRFNNPSFIYQLQQWSMNYFDRFVMLFFLPLSDIGVYDFAIKCMLAIEFIISGLYNSFYPKVIKKVVEQPIKMSTPEINRYYHGLVAIIMLLVCFSILAFSMFVDLGILKSGYEKSIDFLSLIGVVYLLKAIRYYFAFPFGALKYSRPLPWIYMVISLVKVGLIVILVSPFGVQGVIAASVLSTALEIILLWFNVKSKFAFKFNKFKIIIAPLLLAVIIIIFQGIQVFPQYGTYFLYIVICLLLLVGLYRNEVKALLFSKILKQ